MSRKFNIFTTKRIRLETVMRILFLGNNHNLISRTCLKAILNNGSFTALVGIHSPRRPAGEVRTALRRYGLPTVVGKLIRMAGGMFFERARWIGIPIKSTLSLLSLAEKYRCEYCQVENVNNDVLYNRVKQFGPEVIVVSAFSQILKDRIRALPSRGCINMHPSLLPRYRGPSPEYWIVKNKEPRSGVTVHYLDGGIDSGDIVLQKEFLTNPGETRNSLHRRAAIEGASLIVEALSLIRADRVERQEQKEEEATYYSFPRMDSSGNTTRKMIDDYRLILKVIID